jgi:cell wall-associated NlpC family hydrolase
MEKRRQTRSLSLTVAAVGATVSFVSASLWLYQRSETVRAEPRVGSAQATAPTASASSRTDSRFAMFVTNELEGGRDAPSSPDIWALPVPTGLSVGGPDPLDAPLRWRLPDGLRGLAVLVKVGHDPPQWMLTNAGTTFELLDALDVTVASADVVRPSGRAELSHGMTVQVIRMRQEQVTIVEDVPYDTITRFSDSLGATQFRTLQEGVPGKIVRTYLITYRNGRPALRELQSETVLSDPVSRILERGADSNAYSSTAYSAPPVSGGAAAAVSAAYSVIGVPYLYGGISPSTGFDCSGLTMWAWAHGGVSLPHSAAAQYSATRRVSRSDLKAGDLLFFYSGASHVAMYVGGNQMIMALKTGTNVQLATISSYWWGVYVGAGRPG